MGEEWEEEQPSSAGEGTEEEEEEYSDDTDPENVLSLIAHTEPENDGIDVAGEWEGSDDDEAGEEDDDYLFRRYFS